MPLSRDKLLKAVVRQEKVEVPALNDHIMVRGLTASQVIEMAREYGTENGDLPMLIYGCVDELGNPMFTRDDLPALAALPFEVVSPLLPAVKRLSFVDDAGPKQPAGTS